jgi:uncharacterized membrane protein SpoIIM required for sporulation
MPSSSIIEIVAFLIAGLGGLFLLVQNYQYWRKYGGNDLLLWVIGGALAVALAVVVLVTRFLVPATLDTHVLALLTLFRRLFIAIVFFFFLFIGFREYVWRK